MKAPKRFWNAPAMALVIAATGGSARANTTATDGYSDNPCTASYSAVAMHYVNGKVVWTNTNAGPDVFATTSMTCRDGQTSTATVQLDANAFLTDKLFYDNNTYRTWHYNDPQPYVTMNGNGTLTFGNGYKGGLPTTPVTVSDAPLAPLLKGTVITYWKNQDQEWTDARNLQLWKTADEGKAGIALLPKYDPTKETVSNAYSKSYPAFPFGDVRSGGLGSTPRPLIRITYTGPAGVDASNGAPKYLATVYCFPGQGDQNLYNRPMIVSDAFDPMNKRGAWTVYSAPQFSRLLSLTAANGPRALGYDVFFVDFSQGGGNMLINASLFLKAIEWMHAKTQSPIMVGGPSQGGMIPRVALLYSIPENNLSSKDLAPRVKGYLSIDTPHQGASISANMQKSAYECSVDGTVNTLAGFAGEENTAKEEWTELSVPTSYQMLYSHYYSGTGKASPQSHDDFYAFLKALANGKSLGDPRGYRKDIPRVAIAYSNFRVPLGGKDPYTRFQAGYINVTDPITNSTLFSRNIMAGGPAPDPNGEFLWHEMEPGSTYDEFFSPVGRRSPKFIHMYNFTNTYTGKTDEPFSGTFMPIVSVLDLANFDGFHPATTDENELAAYSPFDAVYYMRDSYNGYADWMGRARTYTGDEARYEHIVFDDQLMAKIICGLRYLEDAAEKKVLTLPVYDPGYKALNALGPAYNSPAVHAPFRWNGSSGGFDNYSTTLPSPYNVHLTDGLAKVYEGKFDDDLWPDLLVAQGHRWTGGDILLTSPGGNAQLTPLAYARPEMGENAKVSVADINGDGYDDIVTSGNAGQTDLIVDLCNGAGGFTTVRQANADFVQRSSRPEVKVVTGDFNGDYNDDIVLIGGIDWSDIRVAWSNGNGTFGFQTIANSSGLAWPAAQRGARVLVGAFQQRGQASLAVVNGNSVTTAAFAGGSASVLTSGLSSGSNAFGTWMADPRATVVTADFNGDGMTDMALTGVPGWASIPAAFATGNGGFRFTNVGLANFPGWAATAHVQVTAADLNQDGKADLAIYGGNGWSTVPVAYSNGDGSFQVANLAASAFAAQAGQPGVKRIAHPLSLVW